MHIAHCTSSPHVVVTCDVAPRARRSVRKSKNCSKNIFRSLPTSTKIFGEFDTLWRVVPSQSLSGHVSGLSGSTLFLLVIWVPAIQPPFHTTFFFWVFLDKPKNDMKKNSLLARLQHTSGLFLFHCQ